MSEFTEHLDILVSKCEERCEKRQASVSLKYTTTCVNEQNIFE